MKNTLWTIGHSNRSIEELIHMLKSYGISTLVDVRRFPGSRKFPQYNEENLSISLLQSGIEYIHMEVLGGRRKALKNSKNTGWEHHAFRGYADYMETGEFKDGIQRLKNIIAKSNSAIMCSEALWWSCHRRLISDLLYSEGYKVIHILSASKSQEHPFPSPARLINGKLSYEPKQLNLNL